MQNYTLLSTREQLDFQDDCDAAELELWRNFRLQMEDNEIMNRILQDEFQKLDADLLDARQELIQDIQLRKAEQNKSEENEGL
jgi:hypothetical protein